MDSEFVIGKLFFVVLLLLNNQIQIHKLYKNHS